MNLLTLILSCIGIGFGVIFIICLIKTYLPAIIKVVGIIILLAVIAVAGYFLSTITINI